MVSENFHSMKYLYATTYYEYLVIFFKVKDISPGLFYNIFTNYVESPIKLTFFSEIMNDLLRVFYIINIQLDFPLEFHFY